ncbi:hypothetical protein POM88_017040 [Heracleum sosnowskyi]|uniref:Uncharacterized protein n=1 Tax=Heracleum sosnowskyi TaxID=360622 RepID=A0AAD8MY02_9APIA|nr:hypothetical protein POM88_017040 [Heracleum sosnowskyi]
MLIIYTKKKNAIMFTYPPVNHPCASYSSVITSSVDTGSDRRSPAVESPIQDYPQGFLVCGSGDSTVRLWEYASGSLLHTCEVGAENTAPLALADSYIQELTKRLRHVVVEEVEAKLNQKVSEEVDAKVNQKVQDNLTLVLKKL